MRSVFYPELLNGPQGDPALYVRIAHRGNAFLFDCGDIHALSPREALKVEALFISHAHIDHMIGFSALLRFFLYRDTPLSIYGPPGITDRIIGHLNGYTWDLIRDYPIRIYVNEFKNSMLYTSQFIGRRGFKREERKPRSCPDGVLLELPYVRISALPLIHGKILSLAYAMEEPLHIGIHKDALIKYGYRPGPWLGRFKDMIRSGMKDGSNILVPFENNEKKEMPLQTVFEQIAHTEKGMKLSYVTDATPCPANIEKLVPFISGSHFLAIEAVFSHQDLSRAQERNHLTARLAGEIAARSRCLRFQTFHHSPRYQDRPGLLAGEAQQAFFSATGFDN